MSDGRVLGRTCPAAAHFFEGAGYSITRAAASLRVWELRLFRPKTSPLPACTTARPALTSMAAVASGVEAAGGVSHAARRRSSHGAGGCSTG